MHLYRSCQSVDKDVTSNYNYSMQNLSTNKLK